MGSSIQLRGETILMANDTELYSTWADDSSRQKAFSEASDAYENNDGVQKATAYSYRSYTDIEPNRTVRTSMTRNDYYRFRPEEAVPTRQKRILKMSMDAYDRVGIIRNVIDLMGDFGSQGVDIVHPNKSIEKFYKAWFKQIKGPEKSERFLNYLYRTGNVIIKRSTAKVNAEKEDQLRKSMGADIEIVNAKIPKREIPWRYDFLNPLTVDVLNYYNGMFLGEPIYVLNLSKTTYDTFTAADMSGKQTFSKLPPDLQAQIKQGKRQIRIDPEMIEVFYYKKDDWLVWANPMVYAILDDLIMLEKMKLADLAALDGAISSIRLWNVGSLEHKIIPKKDVINKLRDIIASNTGGGTMDLIWGPELSFKESSSEAYKFLGSEKYQPVLTSIYAGLGIPPSLAGSSSSGGSYANNYVSLKTLIERLEYGRMLLTQFWEKEIKIVQKAMGFKLPAQIRFDNIILSDEAAEKQLLINLSDRGVLSDQTILERFGELPDIERVRTRREEQARRTDISTPMKASPYHNPNTRNDVAKILVTKDALADDYYHDELSLPKRKIPSPAPAKLPSVSSDPASQDSKSIDGKPQGGRPPGKRDKIKRKTKTIGETAAKLWAYDIQKLIAEEVTPMMLSYYNKKNVRSLTKGEFDQLEYFKLCLLTNIEPFIDLSPEIIKQLIESNGKPTAEFLTGVGSQIDDFVYLNSRKPTVDEMRYIYASVYVDLIKIEEIN
jgi:hypothetical protein